jgi:hypothetical protein
VDEILDENHDVEARELLNSYYGEDQREADDHHGEGQDLGEEGN